jgi:hypothetical protein
MDAVEVNATRTPMPVNREKMGDIEKQKRFTRPFNHVIKYDHSME